MRIGGSGVSEYQEPTLFNARKALEDDEDDYDDLDIKDIISLF